EAVGGEIRPTPAVVWRVFAIHGYTFAPGSCPPSPGFAPCAILIWISFALTRYSLVTPKRPEATCLIAEFFQSPLGSRANRSGSSPPSPVLLLAPMRLIAIARRSCASLLIEPYDMAPVLKRFMMLSIGSTSPSGIASRALRLERARSERRRV